MQNKAGDLIDITKYETGIPARVRELHGGSSRIGKLEAMGIVAGAVIVKRSSTLMKGPIILEKGNMQVAIGYEMAKGIFVEPVD